MLAESSQCEFNEFTIPADGELEIDLNKPQESEMERKADELMWFCPCLVIGLLLFV